MTTEFSIREYLEGGKVALTDPAETATYRKKPVTITAWQWQDQDRSMWPTWVIEKEPEVTRTFGEKRKLKLPTLEGPVTASFGDFVVQGVRGEVYPVKPDIFADTYERCDERAAGSED